MAQLWLEVVEVVRGRSTPCTTKNADWNGKCTSRKPDCKEIQMVSTIEDCAKDGGKEFFTEMHCVRITNL